MIVKLKLSDITIPQGMLPRILTGTVSEVVERYVQALEAGEEFPPIRVWKRQDGTYWLVDGVHRISALKKLNKEYVEAEIVELSDEIEFRKEAIKSNLRHGLPLSNDEKRENMRLLYKLGEKDLPQLAKLFAVSERTARYWTEDIREKEAEELRKRALELKEQGKSLKEIGEELGVDKSTISRMLQNGKIAKMQLTLPPSKEAIQLVSEWLETLPEPIRFQTLAESLSKFIEGKAEGDPQTFLIEGFTKPAAGIIERLLDAGLGDSKTVQEAIFSQEPFVHLSSLAKKKFSLIVEGLRDSVFQRRIQRSIVEKTILESAKKVISNPRFVFSNWHNLAVNLRSSFPTWKAVYGLDYVANLPYTETEILEVLRKHADELLSLYQQTPEITEEIVDGLGDIWDWKPLSLQEFIDEVTSRGYRPVEAMWHYYQNKVKPSSPPPPPSSDLAGSQPALSNEEEEQDWDWSDWSIEEEEELQEQKKKQKTDKDDSKFDQRKQLEELEDYIVETYGKIVVHWGPDITLEARERIDRRVDQLIDAARKGRWREVRL